MTKKPKPNTSPANAEPTDAPAAADASTVADASTRLALDAGDISPGQGRQPANNGQTNSQPDSSPTADSEPDDQETNSEPVGSELDGQPADDGRTNSGRTNSEPVGSGSDGGQSGDGESGGGGQDGRGRGDRVFTVVTAAAAWSVLGVLVAIVVFLAVQAWPAIDAVGVASFLTEKSWFPDADTPRFGIAALAFGTLLSSALALAIALPVAVGSSLFVTEIAPRRLGDAVGWLVDLLAAVPSVVYGLWGMLVLVPWLIPIQRWIDDVFGFFPPFDSRGGVYGRSIFAASVVLAIMILPSIAAVTREVFRQVRIADREAAIALGATKWETIRLAVLPVSKGGIVAGAMLGLGRALGETIAVALVLAATFDIDFHIFEPGGNTIAANIATKFGEAGVDGRHALVASGLVLFAITFVVNFVARAIIARGRLEKAMSR